MQIPFFFLLSYVVPVSVCLWEKLPVVRFFAPISLVSPSLCAIVCCAHKVRVNSWNCAYTVPWTKKKVPLSSVFSIINLRKNELRKKNQFVVKFLCAWKIFSAFSFNFQFSYFWFEKKKMPIKWYRKGFFFRFFVLVKNFFFLSLWKWERETFLRGRGKEEIQINESQNLFWTSKSHAHA